jgi:8-oxo-dGTP diphosphatase
MEKEHRISSGAIVIENGRVLLVRYVDRQGKTFLVGPGGGALTDEGIDQAVVREVREETGLEIKPGKILFVEDLISSQYRGIKVWHLCSVIGGRLAKTAGAAEEGIIDAGWYSREQLQGELVYPSELMRSNWDSFAREGWETKYLGLGIADF